MTADEVLAAVSEMHAQAEAEFAAAQDAAEAWCVAHPEAGLTPADIMARAREPRPEITEADEERLAGIFVVGYLHGVAGIDPAVRDALQAALESAEAMLGGLPDRFARVLGELRDGGT